MSSPAGTTNGSKARPKRKHSYQVALELQQLLLDDCRSKETKPAVRAVCARTWEILEERKRVLRRVALPKSVDFTKEKAERRAARLARAPREPSFTEDEPRESISPVDSPGTPEGEGDKSGA